MATTTATFLRDYSTALTAKLVSVGGTGTPNAAGYACTNSNGLQSLSITEALVGEFYAYAYDSLGDIAYQGYVLLADDTGTYRVDDTLAAIKADADLGTADGGMVANVAMLGVAIDGYTFTEAQRLMLAAMVGPITGGGTGTNVIKAADESKARITGTYDNLGNRTVTDLDAT